MKFLSSIRVVRESVFRSGMMMSVSVGTEKLRRFEPEASAAWRAEPAP